jgi:hypothetical protein
MRNLTRSFLIVGPLGIGLYAAGALFIHQADAFEFHGGPGNSLSQQADNLSRETARDSADRAELGRKLAEHPRTKQVCTKCDRMPGGRPPPDRSASRDPGSGPTSQSNHSGQQSEGGD